MRIVENPELRGLLVTVLERLKITPAILTGETQKAGYSLRNGKWQEFEKRERRTNQKLGVTLVIHVKKGSIPRACL